MGGREPNTWSITHCFSNTLAEWDGRWNCWQVNQCSSNRQQLNLLHQYTSPCVCLPPLPPHVLFSKIYLKGKEIRKSTWSLLCGEDTEVETARTPLGSSHDGILVDLSHTTCWQFSRTFLFFHDWIVLEKVAGMEREESETLRGCDSKCCWGFSSSLEAQRIDVLIFHPSSLIFHFYFLPIWEKIVITLVLSNAISGDVTRLSK